MMDIDGFWFLSMKDGAGNQEAIACDNWVWGKIVKKMLDDLVELTGVEGKDVVDFMTVIRATPPHRVIEEKTKAQSCYEATLTVIHRRTVATLEKQGPREGYRGLAGRHARSPEPDTPDSSTRRSRSDT